MKLRKILKDLFSGSNNRLEHYIIQNLIESSEEEIWKELLRVGEKPTKEIYAKTIQNSKNLYDEFCCEIIKELQDEPDQNLKEILYQLAHDKIIKRIKTIIIERTIPAYEYQEIYYDIEPSNNIYQSMSQIPLEKDNWEFLMGEMRQIGLEKIIGVRIYRRLIKK